MDPTPHITPSPTSLPQLLAGLLTPAFLSAVIGVVQGSTGSDAMLIPLFFAVAILGSISAGVWVGLRLGARFRPDLPLRGLAIAALVVVCSLASFVASFAGCMAGANLA